MSSIFDLDADEYCLLTNIQEPIKNTVEGHNVEFI